jgi:iron complex outermembrane receptor protein
MFLVRTVALATGVAVLCGIGTDAWAQAADSTAVLTVRLRSDAGPVPFAQVRPIRGTATLTNALGVAALRLRAGPQRIISAKVGFRPDTIDIQLEAGRDTALTRSLTPVATELEAIVVNATRARRNIANEPVRVEIIAGDEVGEKTPTRPQDLTNVVAEMSGIRIQRTAPGRGGAAIRIQGLQGQYTEVLSDELPLPGSVSPGLVLLQMPPLDLVQVEVIKGAATALFGPSALGGVMNLVSRRPDNVTELLFTARTPAGGDAFLWSSRQLPDRVGYTLIADAHDQPARDIDGDGWMDLPGYRRLSVRPRLFWTGAHGARLFGTAGLMAENRDGGTVVGALAPDGKPFDEGVNTRRVDGGFSGHLPLRGTLALDMRAAGTLRSQDARFGDARERGHFGTLFGEATLSAGRAPLDAIIGLAWQRDAYRGRDLPQFDFTFSAPAIFSQATFAPVHWLAASASGRCDAHNAYGTICSPRLSVLLQPQEREWSVRLSGGTGFFAPTPFNEQTEVTGLAPLRPLSGLRAERGRNLALDINGDIAEQIELTVTLFASEIKDAATVRAAAPGGPGAPALKIVNSLAPARSAGAEILAAYDGHPFGVVAHYAYLHATVADSSGARREAPFNPRHNVFIDLSWTDRRGLRIELEANWVGRQALDDDPYRAVSHEYTTIELLAWKRFGRGMVWLSADNLTGVRQSRYAPLVRPSRAPGQAWTVGQWAPVEGRVVNAGLRLQL